jgi:hypothetical protein
MFHFVEIFDFEIDLQSWDDELSLEIGESDENGGFLDLEIDKN